ncbi:hypothetical protein BESB_060600 [Besnoitia besnoiti]|uniref:Uncharacterized protein n=1 Tax=Besnoitia besnoiti TaxID=94643 RepID=A0A2A9MHP7_BESBE|nr:hypothetical protein BESB_060600 [Besnoitia besnoiti]PFH35173.1 hypothetical protein BESB_060600 [Besnoitia besnoiti]
MRGLSFLCAAATLAGCVPAVAERYSEPAAGAMAPVSVHPASVPAMAFLPAKGPPSGIILANGSGNIQSYQVPGVGMTLGAGKKIPFILINNVAASAAQEAGEIPTSEQTEMNRLCANTMGPGFVYSPGKFAPEPFNLFPT